MRIFVDYIEPNGRYRASDSACTVARSMPLCVLTAPVFLEAARAGSPTPECRVFHADSGRYLDEEADLATAGVDERDTLIIVNIVEAVFRDPLALIARWRAAGGLDRRVVVAYGSGSWPAIEETGEWRFH